MANISTHCVHITKLWSRHASIDCMLNPGNANKDTPQSNEKTNKNAKPKLQNKLGMAAIDAKDMDTITYGEEQYDECDNIIYDFITLEDKEEGLLWRLWLIVGVWIQQQPQNKQYITFLILITISTFFFF